MSALRRRLPPGTEVPHELTRHKGVTMVLIVPTLSEVFSWSEKYDVQVGLREIIFGVARLEGPEADADEVARFGAPGSKERIAFVDRMALEDIGEVTLAVARLAQLSKDERGNSSSPSGSSVPPAGEDAVAGSTGTQTPPTG